MKIKEVMNTIEKLNVLRDELNLEKSYVEIYIDDIQYGKEFHTLNELVLTIKREFVNDFWMMMLKNDFVKTYNNTLCSEIECNGYKSKVELFVDC